MVLKSVIAGFLLLQRAFGHYAFSRLKVNNGADSKDWQYIRKPQPLPDMGGGENSIFYPNFDPLSPRIRCGYLAEKSGPNTEIATVNAGDHISAGLWSFTGGSISHGGPGFFYLAKAPDDVDLKSWDGDGDWFKIGELLGNPLGRGMNKDYNESNYQPFWLADIDNTSMNVTIPLTTPPGKYLLRIEHLFLYSQYGMTNFFVECAQLDIKGPGGGSPGPTVKFPGGYDRFDEGIWASITVMGYEMGLVGYKSPGPKVWS